VLLYLAPFNTLCDGHSKAQIILNDLANPIRVFC
jgi:hypothetical protein